jgi:hypothetical protein
VLSISPQRVLSRQSHMLPNLACLARTRANVDVKDLKLDIHRDREQVRVAFGFELFKGVILDLASATEAERAKYSIRQLGDYSFGARLCASGTGVVMVCDPLFHSERGAVDRPLDSLSVDEKYRRPSGATFLLERASKEQFRITLNYTHRISKHWLRRRFRSGVMVARPATGCNCNLRINYNIGPRIEGDQNQWAFDLIDDYDVDNPLCQAFMDLQCGISEAIRLVGAEFAGNKLKDERIRRDVELSIGNPKYIKENLRMTRKWSNYKACCFPLASSLGISLPFAYVPDPGIIGSVARRPITEAGCCR